MVRYAKCKCPVIPIAPFVTVSGGCGVTCPLTIRIWQDHPCSCRAEEVTQSARSRLYRMSSLDALKDLRFENFEKRGRVGLGRIQADSLENAYNQSKTFAETAKAGYC